MVQHVPTTQNFNKMTFLFISECNVDLFSTACALSTRLKKLFWGLLIVILIGIRLNVRRISSARGTGLPVVQMSEATKNDSISIL